MSRRLRVLVPALLVVLVIVAGNAIWGWPSGPRPHGNPNDSAAPTSAAVDSPDPTPSPEPTPRPPLGGTELYGFLPYWQMTAAMADYLDAAPLTTLALFSVTSRRSGAINTTATGYRRITGAIGRRLIDEAHGRKARVDLVFTSFGAEKNGILFGRLAPPPPAPSGSPDPSAPVLPTATPAPPPAVAPWHRTVDELVDLAVELGVDGINVDIELLAAEDRPAYGEFLAELRSALVAAIPKARLTAATEAGARGVGNAAAAFGAGADRLFLMGYDYHFSGSQPGASSPVDRLDGLYTLRWSIDRYVEAGIPRDRILLGLPLYGMRWRMEGPGNTTPVIGQGVVWVPSQHRDLLLDDAFRPGHDDLEVTQLFWLQDGGEWLVTYYDSPTTLRPKLALALDNGLAGAGFWAMGYERGLPGYLPLMRDFRDGDIARSEAPPRP
jgi:hypothetical protein